MEAPRSFAEAVKEIVKMIKNAEWGDVNGVWTSVRIQYDTYDCEIGVRAFRERSDKISVELRIDCEDFSEGYNRGAMYASYRDGRGIYVDATRADIEAFVRNLEKIKSEIRRQLELIGLRF